MSAIQDADVVIVGGGFFGLRIAIFARERLGAERVVVLERENEPMSRASYVNQARVHTGYHYPRSVLTAYRSQVSALPFQQEFAAAIVKDFRHYYAIAARSSKVSARSFEIFSERIGAPLSPAPDNIRRLLDDSLVEGVWEASEWAFDSHKLRELVMARAEHLAIQVVMGVDVVRVSEGATGLVAISASGQAWRAPRIISAVYSHINELHERSGLELIPVQQEVTEMLLLRLPPVLSGTAFTVMDGPFFSLMPFPSRALHSLSHVRYTPLRRWRENAAGSVRAIPRRSELDRFASAREPILLDVGRYLPAIRDVEVVDSLREVKTVLLSSDHTDSRPILVRESSRLPGYTYVLGGKIDNIGDVLNTLAESPTG